MTDELRVWLADHLIANLRRTRRSQLELRYTDTALRTHGAGSIVVSVALPTQNRAHRGRQVEYWAESLLPEGESRTHIETQFSVRRGDTFALLAAIGADCAGAISFHPDGQTPTNSLTSVTPLDENALATAVDELPQHPLGVDQDVRVSLGGLQAKLLLSRTPDGRWARPTGGAPSTHILKPDPPGLPGLVASEAFTLRLARAADIEATDAELLRIHNRDALLLTRFDREDTNHGVRRIHQEDACAALGLDPTGAKKYESLAPEAPSLVRIADILARHGTDLRTDLTRLAEAVTVRLAVGDTDGHARNYGLLHTGHAVRLTPLYDAAPTYRFASTRQVGLWVGGQSMLTAITPRHLQDELRSWKMPAKLSNELPGSILERLRAALPQAREETPQLPDQFADDISERIQRLLDAAA